MGATYGAERKQWQWPSLSMLDGLAVELILEGYTHFDAQCARSYKYVNSAGPAVRGWSKLDKHQFQLLCGIANAMESTEGSMLENPSAFADVMDEEDAIRLGKRLRSQGATIEEGLPGGRGRVRRLEPKKALKIMGDTADPDGLVELSRRWVAACNY